MSGVLYFCWTLPGEISLVVVSLTLCMLFDLRWVLLVELSLVLSVDDDCAFLCLLGGAVASLTRLVLNDIDTEVASV